MGFKSDDEKSQILETVLGVSVEEWRGE